VSDEILIVKNNKVPASLRVLIIEDEAIVRVTMVETLLHLGIKFVASALDAVSAIEADQAFKPDAIICDIDLGAGPNGIDVAHALRRSNPKLGIIFLSALTDPRLKNPGVRGLPSGAIYLKKADVNRSTIFLDCLISLIARNTVNSFATNPSIKMSKNQIEILQLVASGLSNSEIAKVRSTTLKSTENGIARLAKSLKIKNESNANQRVLLTRHYFELTGKINKAI
jgi:DNA-binding NarL/FixJ family response regulator